MSIQTGSISFESTKGLQSYAKQNYATLSQIKGQFATCGTGASTAAKIATIVPENNDWALYTGATVTVKFTSENTTSTPTLNVNGTGAKPIKDYNGNDLTKAAYEWLEGAAMALTYDGSSWRIQDSNLMERVHSAETGIEQNANEISLRATKEEVNNAIDDIKITKSACGRSILTEDTADLPLLDLSIYGECSQDGTPTPDSPVEVKAVRGRNLFDPNSPNMLRAYFASDIPITSSSERLVYYTPCKAGKTYTASRLATTTNERFSIGYTNQLPEVGVDVYGVAAARNSQTVGNQMEISTTTGQEAQYVVVWVYWENPEESLSTFQLEAGANATRYTPYGCIAAISHGRNVWDEEWEAGAISGGSPASASNTIRSKNFNRCVGGQTYYGKCGDYSNGYYLRIWWYDANKDSISGNWIAGTTAVAPSNAVYFKISTNTSTYVYGSTYNHDICINVSDPDFNGQYEPYRESVSYIDLQGEELQGLNETYRDILEIDASGHAVLTKRTRSFDIDTFTGIYGQSSSRGGISFIDSDALVPESTYTNFLAKSSHNVATYDSASWVSGHIGIIGAQSKIVCMFGPEITTVAEAKTAYPNLNGVYALAESAWHTIDLGYIDLPTTFPNGTVLVEAEIQPQICGSWWTKSGQEAGAAHQSSVKENAELRITANGITSEVSKITSAKYATTGYNYTLAQIKTYAAENHSDSWTIASDDSIRVGDTVYVKVQDTTRTCPVYIKVKVTKVNSATSITGISHGYEDILPVDTIKSTINQSSDSVKISANHVNIEGAAIFSSGGAYDKSTTVVKSETQWYSSTNATTKANGSWGTSQPTVTAGRYIWQRELITYANGTTAYKPSEAGVCIQGQTDLSSYSTTTQMNTAIGNAVDVEENARKAIYGTCTTAAGTAAKTASCANFELYTGASVTVYFQNNNTVTTPTLNINSTGAKTIKSYTGVALSAAEYGWAAASICTFTYDGIYWRMQDGGALQAKADAATYASNASTSASNASTSASNAASSASAASTSASNASSSASTASTKASEASTSASNAASSATTATNQANAASTSATNAASSASAASTSATNAATSATNAANSATAAAEVMGGYTILWNYENFTTANNGEAYICKLDPLTGTKSDENGWVKWNDTKRTITKQMVNPNTIVPYNIPIYIVCRLSSAIATTGTNYMVWYNSGWKYAAMPTPSAVGGTWTWAETTDIVLGKFVETASEAAFVEMELYNPPWGAKQLTTTTTTAASAQATANTANTTANNAAPKTSAVSRTQRIYYRTNTALSGSITGPTTWISESGNKYNTTVPTTVITGWSTKPTPLAASTAADATKYLYLYTCTQTQTVSQAANNGTGCSASTVLLDDTETIIDGGKIITGSIEANSIKANSITANQIAANAVTADKISVDNLAAINSNLGTLTAGTIDASKVTVKNIDATKITVNKIQGNQINVSSINIGDLAGEIGGRNLLHGTNKGKENWGALSGNGSYSSLQDIDTIGVRYTINTQSTNWCVFTFSGTDDSVAARNALATTGEKFTISFDIRSSVSIAKTAYANRNIYFCNSDSTKIQINFGPIPLDLVANTWHHVELTGTTLGVAANVQHFYWNYTAPAGTYDFKNLKLERGNKATDWTPAPEDADAAISTAQATAAADATTKANAAARTALTDAKAYTDSVEVGGRNLALGSKHMNTSAGTGNRYIYPYNHSNRTPRADGFNESVVSANYHGVGIFANSLGLEVGDTVTFSCNVRNDSEVGNSLAFYAMAYDSEGHRVQTKLLHFKGMNGEGDAATYWLYNTGQGLFPAGTTIRVSLEITWLQLAQDLMDGGGDIRFTFQCASADWSKGNMALWAPKLERGNRATDWTPAPEDVDSAIDDASKIASNYITHIDNNGIKIHPQSGESNRVSIDGSAIWMYRNNYLKARYANTITLYGGSNTSGANPKVELTSSDFKMTDSVGTQRLLLNSTSGAIIGNPSKGRTRITDVGMTVYDTNNKKRTAVDASGLHVFDASTTPVEVALFGSTVGTSGTTTFARIGADNSSRFEISPTTLSAYTGTTKYFEVSANGLTWGESNTAATITQVSESNNAANTVVTVYPTAIDYAAGTATLAVKCMRGTTEITPSAWEWTKGTSTTSIGTNSTLQVTDLTAIYNCTVTIAV